MQLGAIDNDTTKALLSLSFLVLYDSLLFIVSYLFIFSTQQHEQQQKRQARQLQLKKV